LGWCTRTTARIKNEILSECWVSSMSSDSSIPGRDSTEFVEFKKFRKGKKRTPDPKLADPLFLIWQTEATRIFFETLPSGLDKHTEFAMFCAATNYDAYQRKCNTKPFECVLNTLEAVSSPDQLQGFTTNNSTQ